MYYNYAKFAFSLFWVKEAFFLNKIKKERTQKHRIPKNLSVKIN